MINSKPTYRDYIYVGIQLVLFVAYILPITIFPITNPDWLRYSGFVLMSLGVILGVIALIQINVNLSPFPTPLENSALITKGVFALSRHPIYTAILLAALGYAIFQTSIYRILIFIFLMTLFYFKSKYEERLLLEKFPAYNDYKKRTRRFI